MLDCVWNLRTSEIELRQQLPEPECAWLISRLLAKHGVADAKWWGNRGRLFVEYDADIFGTAELVDFLQACSIPVAAVRAGYSQASGKLGEK